MARFRRRPWFWIAGGVSALWLVYAVSPGPALPGGAATRWEGGLVAAAFTIATYAVVLSIKVAARTLAGSIRSLPWDPGLAKRQRTEAERGARARQMAHAEEDLRVATKHWTLPVLMRRYVSGDLGDRHFEHEAAILAAHRYVPALQSEQGGHLHAGRILLTGGLSILAGRSGIRSGATFAVTFRKTEH